MRKDIENRQDVELLVDRFYDRVKDSDILGPIFNEVARVDWAHHLPKMYSFWASIVLGEHSYAGNPMTVHIALSKQTAMTAGEFDEWLKLFTQVVDAHFEGPNANEAKARAANIARLMLFKVEKAGEGE